MAPTLGPMGSSAAAQDLTGLIAGGGKGLRGPPAQLPEQRQAASTNPFLDVTPLIGLQLRTAAALKSQTRGKGQRSDAPAGADAGQQRREITSGFAGDPGGGGNGGVCLKQRPLGRRSAGLCRGSAIRALPLCGAAGL